MQKTYELNVVKPSFLKLQTNKFSGVTIFLTNFFENMAW